MKQYLPLVPGLEAGPAMFSGSAINPPRQDSSLSLLAVEFNLARLGVVTLLGINRLGVEITIVKLARTRVRKRISHHSPFASIIRDGFHLRESRAITGCMHGHLMLQACLDDVGARADTGQGLVAHVSDLLVLRVVHVEVARGSGGSRHAGLSFALFSGGRRGEGGHGDANQSSLESVHGEDVGIE